MPPRGADESAAEPLDETPQRPGVVGRLILRLTRPLRRAWRSDAALDDFALVHFASVLGDTCAVVALAFTAFGDTGGDPGGKVAAYLIFTMLPLAIAGFPLVPLMDRAGPRRMIAFVAAAGRCALAIVLITGLDTDTILFPAAFGILILRQIHGITKNGLTMAYAGEEHQDDLVQANARLARWGVVAATIMGPIAGLVAKGIGPPGAMVLAVGGYALTAFLVLRLPHPHVPPRTGEVSKLGKLPELRVAAAGVVGLRIATGFLIVFLAFQAQGADVPDWWIGLLVAAGGFGLFAGDFLAPRLPARLREEGIVLVALIAAGVGGILAFTAFGLPALVIFCLLSGMAGEFGRLALQGLAQRYVPERAHGRVFVRYEVVFQIAWVGGALIPALIPIDFKTGILLMGVFYLMVAGLFVARPLVAERSEKRRPSSAEPFDQGSM